MMDKLTLVIPAKNESESLPRVLKELEFLKIKTIVVIPAKDNLTKLSIKQKLEFHNQNILTLRT